MFSKLTLPASHSSLESFGCKLSPGGTHNSRTMMLEEISRLILALPPQTTANEYRSAVVDGNILGKSTVSTREKTFRHLRELYALSEGAPIFPIYRTLFFSNPHSAPLLSFVVAWSRDPLLRATSEPVFSAGVGVEVTRNIYGRHWSGPIRINTAT